MEAVGDTNGSIYFSSMLQTEDKVDEVSFVPIAKSVTKKIRDNVNLYFRKEVKANKAFEVTVNSPNVIIYASSEKTCSVPNE